MAKNFRQSKSLDLKMEPHRKWKYEDMFIYKDFNQIKTNGIIGATHILPTLVMKRFIPKLEDIHFLDAKTVLK